MRGTFAETATAISNANYLLNKNSHRINTLLTLNADQLARMGETPQAFLRRMTANLRNLYRDRPHAFAGVWRFEIGTVRYGGRHYHLAYHSPRGLRDKILDALQRWHDEPLDARLSSKSFRHAKWHVVGVRRGWELRRIHALDGALDYLAKVPLDADGTPVPRDTRLAGAGCRVREFGTFGQR